jgi:hypothetical protein
MSSLTSFFLLISLLLSLPTKVPSQTVSLSRVVALAADLPEQYSRIGTLIFRSSTPGLVLPVQFVSVFLCPKRYLIITFFVVRAAAISLHFACRRVARSGPI